MSWQIYWDNGANACGVFPSLIFDSEEEAEAYAEDLLRDNIAEGVWEEEAEAFPIVELPANVKKSARLYRY